MVFEEKPKMAAKKEGEDMETYYKLMVATKQDSNKPIFKSSDSEGKKLWVSKNRFKLRNSFEVMGFWGFALG